MNKKKTLIIVLIAVLVILIATILGLTQFNGKDNDSYLTLDTYKITEAHYTYYCTKGYDAAYVATGAAGASIWDQKIDGKKTDEWIKDYAIEESKRYLVANKLFNELGLEFTQEEIYAINDEVNELWLYGGLGGVYEDMGIEQVIYNDIITTEKRIEKLTEYYKDELSQSITEEDMEAYLVENYASVIYFAMSYTDAESESTLGQYEAYCKEVENGKSLETLVKELHASDNKFIVTSIAKEVGRNDTVITASGSGFPLEYVSALFEAEAGEIVPFDDTAANIYVLSQRTDILADNYYMNMYRDDITNALLAERYEDKISEETASYDVDINRVANRFDVEALYIK